MLSSTFRGAPDIPPPVAATTLQLWNGKRDPTHSIRQWSTITGGFSGKTCRQRSTGSPERRSREAEKEIERQVAEGVGPDARTVDRATRMGATPGKAAEGMALNLESEKTAAAGVSKGGGD